MKLLLDTHIFLWFISGDARLPDAWTKIIRNSDVDVYLSVISIWEAIIKHQIGKLPLPLHPEIYLTTQRERHRMESLPLDEESVRRLASLPFVHRDPFDRMLICQSIEHDLTIVTLDSMFRSYPVSTLDKP